MGFLRFTLKSTVAGGIVYYTVQEGLWGTPEESAKLYDKCYKKISPMIQKNVPQDFMDDIHRLPNPSKMRSCVASYWNRGVTASIKFIADIPNHATSGVEWIQTQIEKSTSPGNETNNAVENK